MPTTAKPSIEMETLRKDLFDLSRIGRNEEDRGLYRTAFSDADMEARRWLMDRLREMGLEPTMDGAANVLCPMKRGRSGKSIIVGSHLDTVPCAGALDGALGVITALECLRALQHVDGDFNHDIELVAFSDEEGRFGGMFGSQAFCGDITPETLEYFSDLEQSTLADAMRKQGLDPWKALEAKRDPNSVASYLELHIEQGPVLDRTHKQVGVVENITGLFKWLIRIRGEPNHAGTTPMDMRNDAFMGLADFAHEIPRILEENGAETSRATIGRAQILPGAPNTVPGLVEFSLDVRDSSPEVLEELATAFRRALSAVARRRKLMFEFDIQSEIAPVDCDRKTVDALQKQAKSLGLDYLVMPSGAAHDAQIMARISPIGMIFVPSKDGQSHSPAEWTDWDHIEAGANLALHTLIDLAK